MTNEHRKQLFSFLWKLFTAIIAVISGSLGVSAATHAIQPLVGWATPLVWHSSDSRRGCVKSNRHSLSLFFYTSRPSGLIGILFTPNVPVFLLLFHIKGTFSSCRDVTTLKQMRLHCYPDSLRPWSCIQFLHLRLFYKIFLSILNVESKRSFGYKINQVTVLLFLSNSSSHRNRWLEKSCPKFCCYSFFLITFAGKTNPNKFIKTT